LVILLFGAPGSGKGTQGRLILDWLQSQIPCISTGEMLRSEIAADSELGRETKATIAAGSLVSDEIINRIVQQRIGALDCRDGFMLDGYPRTIQQAEFLDEQLSRLGMSDPVVIHLDVPTEVLVNRIVCRRQCQECGSMYNVLFKRPRKPGKCDECGGRLIVRHDDREEVIRERLRAYNAQTLPVLRHYADRNYCRIDGDASPKQIFDTTVQYLESFVAAAVR